MCIRRTSGFLRLKGNQRQGVAARISWTVSFHPSCLPCHRATDVSPILSPTELSMTPTAPPTAPAVLSPMAPSMMQQRQQRHGQCCGNGATDIDCTFVHRLFCYGVLFSFKPSKRTPRRQWRSGSSTPSKYYGLNSSTWI